MKNFKSLNKVAIDIVYGCQLRCIGCPISILQPKIGFMPVDTFKQCLKDMNVRYVRIFRLFNFGEPLLHPNLVTLLEEVPKIKMGRVEISTNAMKLDREKLTEIFKQKIVTHLVVSCDGDGTAEEYERLRPPAKWDKLVAFLETARELREKYNPHIELITRNIIRKEKDKKRWKKVLNGWIPNFRKMRIIADSQLRKNGAKVRVGKGVCDCLADNNLYINYKGEVVPCCVHPKAAILGDLITYIPQKKKFIKQLRKNRANVPVCNECEE